MCVSGKSVDNKECSVDEIALRSTALSCYGKEKMKKVFWKQRDNKV